MVPSIVVVVDLSCVVALGTFIDSSRLFPPPSPLLFPCSAAFFEIKRPSYKQISHHTFAPSIFVVCSWNLIFILINCHLHLGELMHLQKLILIFEGWDWNTDTVLADLFTSYPKRWAALRSSNITIYHALCYQKAWALTVIISSNFQMVLIL